MQQIKRRNARLPVVIIDAEADLRRRHDLLKMGADLYLTKPSPQRLQPGFVEEELALFADELLLTDVGLEVEGDTFFPEWDRCEFEEVSREPHMAANGTPFAFVTYERTRSGEAPAGESSPLPV
jgi:CheY-like chemotaxis protein